MHQAPEAVRSRVQRPANGHATEAAAPMAPATPPFVTVQNRWKPRQ